MNGLQALPNWNEFMEYPSGAWLGFVNAIYWLGNGINFPIAAWVSNKYGRKRGVYIGYAYLILGATLQTAAPNRNAFLLARLFLGAASAWFGNSVPLLMNEISYPTTRGVFNALFMCGWYLGSIVSAWVTFGTRNYGTSWDWRLPSLFQVLLPVLAIPGFLLAPESPRWLVSVGRTEEAAKILANAHAGGDESSPLVIFEKIEIETTINNEKEAARTSSYLDMIKTPGNRWRLGISVSLGIFGQWSGNGVVSCESSSAVF